VAISLVPTEDEPRSPEVRLLGATLEELTLLVASFGLVTAPLASWAVSTRPAATSFTLACSGALRSVISTVPSAMSADFTPLFFRSLELTRLSLIFLEVTALFLICFVPIRRPAA
jgi:hypothetical protein